MNGAQVAGLDQRPDHVAGAAFQRQVDRRRGAVLAAQHFAQVHRRTQLAGRRADQHQYVAGLHRGEVGAFRIVGQQAHAAHRGGRWNGRAVGLVVEADVATHDGEVECAAGLGHALDGPHDLAHDFRPFGVAEVEVVGDGDGLGAHGGQVAPGLGDRLFATLVGVVLDVAGRNIGGHGQRLAPAVHAHDPGVGAGG